MSSKPSRGVGSDGAQAVDQQRQHVDGSPALAVSTEEKKIDERYSMRRCACSLGLSATSQQYFSLKTNQQPASSTFLSEQTSTSHQPPAK
jgi:hypothetical protein